eukprot:scaffold46_cov196-Ochromonas_danica.AAC.6
MKLQAVESNDILQDSLRTKKNNKKKRQQLLQQQQQQQQQRYNGTKQDSSASPSSMTSSTKGENVMMLTPPPSVMENVKSSPSSSSPSSSLSWFTFRTGSRSVLPLASVFFCIHGVVDELPLPSDCSSGGCHSSVGGGHAPSMSANKASTLQPQHGLWGLDNCFIMRWNAVKDQHPSPLVKVS